MRAHTHRARGLGNHQPGFTIIVSARSSATNKSTTRRKTIARRSVISGIVSAVPTVQTLAALLRVAARADVVQRPRVPIVYNVAFKALCEFISKCADWTHLSCMVLRSRIMVAASTTLSAPDAMPKSMGGGPAPPSAPSWASLSSICMQECMRICMHTCI